MEESRMRKKVVLALIASVIMAQSGITYTAHAMQDYQYYDMTDDNAGYIETVLNAGIMSAKNAEDFGTEEQMTRFEVLDVLYRLDGSPAVTKDATFEDAKGHKEVAFAESAGLFNDLPETFFEEKNINGDTKLSKEEFAVILYNYANYDKILKMDTTAVRLINYLSVYADGGEVDEWAKTAVKWNLGYEFLKSVDNSEYLKINETITKGEVAEAIAKYMGEVEKVKNASSVSVGNHSQSSATSQSANKGSEAGNTVQNESENAVVENTPENESKNENSENPENQPMKPTTPGEEETHTHRWVPRYEMLLVDRQEGYHKLEKVSEEEGHYEKVEVSPEEGHYGTVEVSPEEGHYEKVEVSPEEGHYEKVEVSPEEGHFENRVVEEAWTETVKHPAETEEIWKVDKEAWTETVNHPEEGHFEETPIYETQIRHICSYCHEDCTGNELAHGKQHSMAGEPSGYYDEEKKVQIGTEKNWVVDKEAWTETVNHPEEGHFETVVVKPAWTEEIQHPARYEKVWIVDKEAVYEDQWIVDKEAVYEDQWIVDKEAVYETVWVDPVEAHEENSLVGFECAECGKEIGGPKFII